MADKQKPQTLEEALLQVTVRDPVDSLVKTFNDKTDHLLKTFNDRSEAIVTSIKQLDTNYQEQLGEIKQQLKDSSAAVNRTMIAVIIVLALGFVSLLVAIIAVIITSWQFSSDSYKDKKQDESIQMIYEKQMQDSRVLEEIKKNTQPKE
jgi:hypothetical protein